MQERTNMAKDTFSSTHHHSLYNNHHHHSSHHKSFTSSFSERTTMPPKTMGGFDSSSKSSLKRPHSAIQKGGFQYSKEPTIAAFPAAIEQEVLDADILLPSVLPFKKMQVSEKYPKGQARVRYWKHLKQILQAENYHLYPADEPNYANIESPPSMYPAKKYCDVTGFPAPYTDPRTKLRYANTEVFQKIRNLPEDYVQGYLSLRNAAVVLK